MGSKQGGVRPTLAVQNDAGNRYSDMSIAAAIISK
ncbi:type II toxin-antitoxin system PemK/MazF family toxin [Ruthenibacterium lactatiformans]